VFLKIHSIKEKEGFNLEILFTQYPKHAYEVIYNKNKNDLLEVELI